MIGGLTMIEIVFSDSARWSLLLAQQPGHKNTVYGFELGLSVGDISQEILGPVRYQVLYELCGRLPEPWQLDRKLEEAAAALPDVLARSSQGELVRIWYSDQPDELCGLCWMLERLDSLKERCGPISAVRLPRYQEQDGHTIVEWSSWGEVADEEWHGFLPLERPVTPILRRICANRWRDLEEENAPLRAVLNGRLVSAPEDLYDSFLRRELDRMEDEFSGACLVGGVIGHHQLGVSDCWLGARVEAMVQAGKLEAVTQAAEGDMPYRRVFRKVKK